MRRVDSTEAINFLQRPAMLVRVIASWLVVSSQDRRPHLGFWAFLLSSLLWAVCGWTTEAWSLVMLQLALATMNIRVAKKNEDDAKSPSSTCR